MQQLHGKVKYNEVVDAEYVTNASGVQMLLSCGEHNTGQQTVSRPNRCKRHTDQVGATPRAERKKTKTKCRTTAPIRCEKLTSLFSRSVSLDTQNK